tara:strand:- start:152 stop:493 length:342 start_codon:yes stop_codon:yes gene_type:complete
MPPELKKYRIALALANVTVLDVVALAVQPEVVDVVAVESLPLLAALLLPEIALTFVLSAAYAAIVLPAVGFAIAEIVVPWCAAALAILVSKVAHCVAVTVAPTPANPTVLVWP